MGRKKDNSGPKKATPKNTMIIHEASGTFVTLRIGKERVEDLLNSANPTFLSWVARNTLLATQAQTIREQYPVLHHEVEALSLHSPDLPETKRSSDIIPDAAKASAALVPDAEDEGDDHTLEGDETPQSAQRTPSLKLKFGGTPTPAQSAAASIPPTPANEDTPDGSTKKRKRASASVDLEKNGVGIAPARVLSLKLNTKQPPSTSKNSAVTPGIKLKTKGKIPKRPQGVGYDSELEEREVDPVILEAFVLRMIPGEDCDYIRDAIASGTVGVSLLQKGADIRLRFLDVNGRRGILIVRGKQYAFTVVDLPTITEGMKSWDKKNFIKSVDISQMCLVLGRCADDEEARNYPLPPAVNPKNYQYAHGLTAPMRNVRKRRFGRTTRTRVDDIEAIERKVNSLLEADAKATDTKWEILDRDPRQDEDEFSDEEYDSDSDAEGEDLGYFPLQNGASDATQTPDQQYTHEDISALEAMFEDDPDEDTSAPVAIVPVNTTLTAASLAATDQSSSRAATPAGDDEVDIELPDADADADADDDDPPDADADDDEDSDHEASDEKAETLVKIKEAEEKIEQERKKLRATNNHILKKKIATKITALENDIRMMKRHAGILEGGDGDGDDGSEEE